MSWKIIAIFRPLIVRRSSAGRRSRSLPAVERPAGGDVARRAVDQVHDRRRARRSCPSRSRPGSPAPRRASMCQLTSRTACTVPCAVWNSTERSLDLQQMRVGHVRPPATSRRQRCMRVGRDPHPAGEQVERQRGQHDRDAREERQPPGGRQIAAALRHHQAPGDLGRLDADAEEAQARFGEHHDRRTRRSRWSGASAAPSAARGAARCAAARRPSRGRRSTNMRSRISSTSARVVRM